ncbi:MAG: hypothetical protein SFW62_03270 [Alphaproteobacteria bacterium]|nr:hypothetical protein [Alphaproteobacteria bacterium]
MLEGIGKAASGTLVGAEGAANHITPLRSYAGAWYVFINRKAWNAQARPSARPTPHSDVAQMWMDVWRFHKQPVELIAPTACAKPKWDLPGRPGGYGIATTYGDHCFHLFESRSGDPKVFLERCGEVIR